VTITSPPARETYRFVLRETLHNPEQSQTFTAYDEATDSRCIVHPDGVRACTIFLWSDFAAARARKLGWVDVTDPWLRSLDGGAAPARSVDVDAPPVEEAVALPGGAPTIGGSLPISSAPAPALSPRRRAV
jgi:hypothetical protein